MISFFASLIGTEMIFWFLTVFIPGPNIGWMQIGLILSGIFDNDDTTLDFSDEISIRYVPLFISFAINLIISGVLLVGVHNTT